MAESRESCTGSSILDSTSCTYWSRTAKEHGSFGGRGGTSRSCARVSCHFWEVSDRQMTRDLHLVVKCDDSQRWRTTHPEFGATRKFMALVRHFTVAGGLSLLFVVV